MMIDTQDYQELGIDVCMRQVDCSVCFTQTGQFVCVEQAPVHMDIYSTYTKIYMRLHAHRVH